jgi:hypothetical protein
MLERMLGAALLKVDTFEDVEHDRGATIQAALVVIIVSIAAGVGGLLSGGTDWVAAIIFGVVGGPVSWALWALVVLLVGTRLLNTSETHADWGQLARGTGFAQTPGIFNVFVFLPVAGEIIGFIVLVWQVAAMVIAVRQCLDYTSTLRAVGVVVISFIPVLIISAVVFWAFGIGESAN